MRRSTKPTASAVTAAIAAPAMPASNTSTSSTVAAALMRLIDNLHGQRKSGARLSDQPAEHGIYSASTNGADQIRIMK